MVTSQNTDLTVEPTSEPTSEPTAFPTKDYWISTNYSLTLNADYDEFNNYTNSDETKKKQMCLQIVKRGVGMETHPSLSNIAITILAVRRGSIIIDYTMSANNELLIATALSNMNDSVGSSMTIGNFTFDYSSHGEVTLSPTTSPTAMPSADPTSNPSRMPTFDPTFEPSTNPTQNPSKDPTKSPTSSPTSGDVSCGDHREGTYHGNWEYYLYIDNDAIVTFDTCSSYLNLFSMRIYMNNGTNSTLYAECVECGSICLKQSQFRVAMENGTYFMIIDGAHSFEMICEPVPNPTSEPTYQPTSEDTTLSPSVNPTSGPTTSSPTEQEIVVNVTVSNIIASTSYLSDPFGRFEASNVVLIEDENGILGHNVVDCVSCFNWQYRSDGEGQWNIFDVQGNDDISVSITKSGDEYTSTLVVQSIRRLNAGNCVDDELKRNHPFEGGTDYEFRMKFEIQNGNYSVSGISNEFNLTTNSLPSGGICIIQNIQNLLPLEPYNLFCDFWETENGTDLEYNALIGDVAMSTAGFVDDARELTGIAPSGNVSITVLVKEQNEYNAITCYEIRETFKSIDEVLSDVPENDTSAEVVESILITIENITSTNSLSENPDMAVSIHSVVEDMYTSNLTSQTEAEQIVDDMVVNILETSIVVSSNETTSNITGDAIITELATVSSITSNEEIVDTETTTTQLVEEYLPDIFDAVDLFIDVSTGNATSNVSTTEVQDALYSIGEQSQELISNLEDTLIGAVDTINVSNATDAEIESVNSLSESLVDFATLAASTALAQSEIGESFNFEATEYDANGNVTKSKVVTALKFAAYNRTSKPPVCGSRTQKIELPLTFMTDNLGIFDCAVMAASTNNFVSKRGLNEGREQKTTDLVTANIYESRSKFSRRRLAETVEHDTNRCFPYLITMQLSNPSEFDLDLKLDESSPFPSCDFWNTNESYWDTAGCFVNDIIDDSVICGCTHLTTFSVSGDDILPEANVITNVGLNELTASNLISHPTVVITCLTLAVVFAVICLINPRASNVHTRSILALEDSVFKSVREEKLWKDVLGKEVMVIFIVHSCADSKNVHCEIYRSSIIQAGDGASIFFIPCPKC